MNAGPTRRERRCTLLRRKGEQDALAALARARDLIADPERWTRSAPARYCRLGRGRGTGFPSSAALPCVSVIAAEPKSGRHRATRQLMGRWKARVRRDFGLSEPSEAQRTVLEAASHAWWMLRELDAAIMEYQGPPDERMVDMIRQRTHMADRLVRDLERLGRTCGPLVRGHVFAPP